MAKRTININSDMDLLSAINKRSLNTGKGEEFDVYVNIEEYSSESMYRLKELVQKLKHFKYEPSVYFNIEGFKLKESDYEQIVDFSIDIEKMNVNTNFYDLTKVYPIEQGVNAFFNAEKFIDAVKSLNPSPLETHYLVYGHVASIKYKENEQERNKARTLISVLTGDDIVCLGYAELLTYLHRRLGVESFVQILSTYDKVKMEKLQKETGKADKMECFLGTHANNIAYIKDDKYNFDGMIYCDATWDSVDFGEENYLRYLYAALPLGDVNHLKRDLMEPEQRIFYAMMDEEEKFALNEDMLFDIGTIREVFADLDRADEYIKIKDELASEQVYFKKKKAACKKLENMLKIANVPLDIYKNAKGMPFECRIEFLIAQFMQENFDESLFNLSLNSFEIYSKNKERFDENSEEFNAEYESIEDVYELLGRMGESNQTKFDSEIKTSYICINGSNKVGGLLNKVNKQTISLDTFKEILVNIYKKQGASDKFINFQVERVITANRLHSKKVFDNKAANCFRRAALRQREIIEMEEEKSEI